LVNVFAVEVPLNIDDKIINNIFSILDKDRVERILKFKFKEDRYRALMSDILSGYLICDYLNIKMKDILISRNEYGKPYLENKDIFFNNSHSGKWVVCGISKYEVGIDVEKIKNIDINIAKRFFHKDEYLYLLKNENKKDFFYKLWTLKESFIKADGRGLSLGLDSFCILPDRNPLRALYNNELSEYYLKNYNFLKDYKVSVCSKSKDFKDDIVVLEFDYLIGEFFKYSN
jgi:4'-phosphopantetheinyl transferase